MATSAAAAVAEEHRLSDVLKLNARSKWALFQRVNTSQGGFVFKNLSVANKDDAAGISDLTKLVATEQKKANYDHVVILLKTIRRYFLDDEKAFRTMVKDGLDRVILASISDLRKKATQGISGQAPVLRSLLTNISDMFEWEFFGENSYRQFIEEMMAVLTGCNDCDDSLFAEAAAVTMSMCTTNISRVFDCFLRDKTSTSMLKKALHNLPRAKSFYYEALLLELVYRLHRHSKKDGNDKMSRYIAKLIEACPAQVARALPHIPPKAFRDETRRILNDFNAQVGVIKSFQLKGLKLSGPKMSKIPVKTTGWIDFGGMILEVETAILTAGEETISTIKLPYTKIDSVTSSKSKPLVSLALNDSVHLSEIMSGDPAITDSTKLRMCLSLDDRECRNVISVLNQRKNTRVVPEITVVSSVMQSDLRGSGTENELPSTAMKAIPPRHSSRRRFEADKPKEGPMQNSTEMKISKQSRPSTHTEPESEHLKPIAKDGASAVAANTDVALCQDRRRSEHKKSSEERVGVVEVLSIPPSRHLVEEKEDEDGHRLFSRLQRSLEVATVVPSEDEAPDDNDQRAITDDHVADQTQKFRLRQSQQLHQLQSLVSDIVQANDHFRHFNIASHCRELVDESDRLLKRKREHRDDADMLESTNVAILQCAAKRAEDLSRRRNLQVEMNDAVSATAIAEADASTCARELLGAIQRHLDSESRQNLDRVQKKLRTQAIQSMAKTKEKLTAIEKAFNTDDLRAMQQMLLRI